MVSTGYGTRAKSKDQLVTTTKNLRKKIADWKNQDKAIKKDNEKEHGKIFSSETIESTNMRTLFVDIPAALKRLQEKINPVLRQMERWNILWHMKHWCLTKDIE